MFKKKLKTPTQTQCTGCHAVSQTLRNASASTGHPGFFCSGLKNCQRRLMSIWAEGGSYHIFSHQGKDQLHWTFKIYHSDVLGILRRHNETVLQTWNFKINTNPIARLWHIPVEVAQGQRRLHSAKNGCLFSLLDEVLEGQLQGSPFQECHISLWVCLYPELLRHFPETPFGSIHSSCFLQAFRLC